MKQRRKLVAGLIGLLMAGALVYIFWFGHPTPCRNAYDQLHLGMSEDAVRLVSLPTLATGNGGAIIMGEWEGIENGEHRLVYFQELEATDDPLLKNSLLRTVWKDNDSEQVPEGV